MFRELIRKPQRRAGAFRVDDVVPASVPIPTETLSDHVSKRFQRKLLFLPEAEKPVANTLLVPPLPAPFPNGTRRRVIETMVSRCHPLIDAVGTAFSQHRPLILSPDSIWLAIEQGFAQHVMENAEALRDRLVRHRGSRELVTVIGELSLPAFELGISNLSAQIREASDPVLHETMICDFSTTTPSIRTASEVVLMDCYSSYFTYTMVCICGIPKITVLGSPNDWQRIRARGEVLRTYDLGWWVGRLRPILDEFIQAAQGNPDVKFWRAIYKPVQAYATKSVTGWIADLFPYLGDSPHRRRNHVFQHDRVDWAIPAGSGVTTGSFPSGLSSVPVKLTIPARRAEVDIDLVAGFLAIEQNPDDLALSPVIGWSVTERAPEKPVMILPTFA